MQSSLYLEDIRLANESLDLFAVASTLTSDEIHVLEKNGNRGTSIRVA